MRRVSLTLGVVMALVLVGTQAPAHAMYGGSPASKAEAPWAVQLQLQDPTRHNIGTCSGVVLRPGYVLTAGHCLFARTYTCNAALVPAGRIQLRFASRRVLISNTRNRLMLHPQFRSRACEGRLPEYDVAVVRYASIGPEPAIPLSTVPNVESVRTKGVTLFGGGLYPTAAGERFSSWMRKSRDHAWVLQQGCDPGPLLCLGRTNGISRTMVGDSGGAWVGWFGRWELIGVHSGIVSGDPNVPAQATSVVDPAVRGWLDQVRSG